MEEIGRHRGGFTPFSCDLGDVGGRDITLVVRARDDWRGVQPRGKQSFVYANAGCLYTRTTGIWQTVWLEPLPRISLRRTRITPDVGNSTIRLVPAPRRGWPRSNETGLRLRAFLSDASGEVAGTEVTVSDFAPMLDLRIPGDRRRLWSPKDPHLYDLVIELLAADGSLLDRISSYAGLRSITLDGHRVNINGVSIFQRLVLDQGYYPDGIMTAHAGANGASGIAMIAPSFFRPADALDLAQFCEKVAAAAPATPFYYYHIPGMTGGSISATELR